MQQIAPATTPQSNDTADDIAVNGDTEESPAVYLFMGAAFALKTTAVSFTQFLLITSC